MISVFDTTISDNNLGNEIIMESVYEIIDSMFPDRFIIKLPALDSIGDISLGYSRQSEFLFFGGTNVLTAYQEKYRQWGIEPDNYKKFSKIILFGVGWWQYQTGFSKITNKILKTVLHDEIIHSVRDSYTEKKMHELGFLNVLNTGCPTLWNLTEQHCLSIPETKADEVLVTFTNYNQDLNFDKMLLDIVCSNYKKIYIWVQGPEDKEYAKILIQSLAVKNCLILPPRLKSLDETLKRPDIDYIGTRLHAGIRAVQFKRRAIIIGVDNRAIEMGKDFNLNVIIRKDIEQLETIINQNINTAIKIPVTKINQWKSQFVK